MARPLARSAAHLVPGAAALLLAAFGPAAAEAPPTTTLALPVGIPVELDGNAAFGEWRDAAEVALEAPPGVPDGPRERTARLRWKQVRGTLLLALESTRPWPRGARLLIYACPDRDDGNALAPGAYTFDFEPLEHSRPHAILRRHGETGWEDAVGTAYVRGAVHDSPVALEAAIQLPALGLSVKAARSLRVAVALTRAAGADTATWPAGLDLGAAVGAAPPDLVSSRRWARLTGIVDSDGPGALSKSTRDRLLAEDAELTAKGKSVHDRANLILEEGGRKLEKEDALVEREVLRPLDWIAAREPLHPADALVRGQMLRHLNRFDAALTAFDALALDRRGDWRESALYERARTLEALERYEEAADAWTGVAAHAPAEFRPRYETAAKRALAAVAERDAERAARAAVEADPASRFVWLTTNRGSVLLCVHAADVPKAAEHFLGLVEKPAREGGAFYDGTRFHRVIGEAFAQGGDPRTRTDGCDGDLSGPASDTVEMELSARFGYRRGAVAFARAQRKENASQFFVLVAAQPNLSREGYTVFAHVVSGLDAVERLERCDTLLSARVLAR